MERTDRSNQSTPENWIGSLEFSAGYPALTSVNARRLSRTDSLSSGKVNATFNTTLALAEDKRTVNVDVTVDAQGVNSKNEPAFEVGCTIACAFLFKSEQSPANIENKRFAALLSGPLYQRSVIQIEELARNMGFPGVRLPLISPSEEFQPDQSNLPPIEKPVRKVRAPRKSIPKK